jgi:hypothetical protein
MMMAPMGAMLTADSVAMKSSASSSVPGIGPRADAFSSCHTT